MWSHFAFNIYYEYQTAIFSFFFFFLRHIKLLETLKEMISSLPINDVTSEELFVNLEKIRAKYKQVGTRWSYTDELMCLEILNMN